jgi:O-antigen/teichoic acid export membrane protein
MTSPRSVFWFAWALPGTMAAAMGSVLTTFFQAEKQFKKLSGIQTVLRVGSLVGIVGTTWVFGFPGYICSQTAASVLSLLGYMWVLDAKPAWSWRHRLPDGFITTGIYALSASITWTVGRTIDLLIMDRLVSDRHLIGCYALATTLLLVPNLVNGTVQAIATPHFSSNSADSAWLRRWALKAQVAFGLGALPVAVLTFAAGAILVKFVFGERYIPALWLLIPLLGGYLLQSTFHVLSVALIGCGYTRINLIVGLIVIPVGVVLTYVMVRRYGVWGAAWAQVATGAVYSVVQSSMGWPTLHRHIQRA